MTELSETVNSLEDNDAVQREILSELVKIRMMLQAALGAEIIINRGESPDQLKADGLEEG